MNMLAPGRFDRWLDKVPKSMAARKRTYFAKLWFWLKNVRLKYWNLGKPEYCIWILGAQRSGTTLLERIFRNDLNSRVYGEFSELTIDPTRTVWKSFPDVAQQIAISKGSYAVARPLFESDRAKEILQAFPNSIAVWMYRDPRYVVNSMVNKWGSDFFNISRRVETDNDGNWRLEELFNSISDEVMNIAGSTIRVEDMYALYWLKRNQTIFTEGLDKDDRIVFLEYAQLVSEPKRYIDRIVKLAGGKGVWKWFFSDANCDSLSRDIDITISPHILERCQSLYRDIKLLGNSGKTLG